MANVKTIFHPVTGKPFKLGRKRPDYTIRRLRFADYLLKKSDGFAAPMPSPCDFSPAAIQALTDIFGNDTLGDCVIAAVFHLIGVWTGNAGDEFVATLAQVVALYSGACGYRGTEATDQGCDIDSVLSYVQANGAIAGGLHKFAGFVRVDPTNQAECMTALDEFEVLIIGLDLPDSYVSPMPSASGFVWDVAGPPNPENGHCFTGDTKVSLLDGREVSFADLAAGAAGESFGVYSCDENGNVVAGNAHSVRLTRKNASLVKVTLDNGEQIRCTRDHRFMLRDGSYREAGMLSVGDSLMPLYRRENKAGYEEFFSPKRQSWQSTHRTVAFGVGGNGGGLVAHHYDFNKRNNSPANLIPMTPSAHGKLHQETAKILSGYATSDRGRSKSSELMSALWADPVWRAKMDANITERTSSGGKATAAVGGGFIGMDREKLRRICRENGKKSIGRLMTPESKQRVSDGIMNRLASDPDLRERKRVMALAASAAATAKPVTDELRAIRRTNALRAAYFRFHSEDFATFEEWVESREPVECANNHKVASVEDAGLEDVYDMTVDNHHNFALSAGVFVHNCIMAYGCSAQGLLICTWGMLGVLTWAAAAKYLVQAAQGDLYTVISQDSINAGTGDAASGINWSQMVADFNAMSVAPAPPTPRPAPVIPPAPAPVIPPGTDPVVIRDEHILVQLFRSGWSIPYLQMAVSRLRVTAAEEAALQAFISTL